MLYLGTMALIDHQWIADEVLLRYLIGHPICKITIAMFFIGAASLATIGLDVLVQFSREGQIRLDDDSEAERPERTDGAEDSEQAAHASEPGTVGPGDSSDETFESPADQAVRLGQSLKQLPASLHSHYLWQRLSKVLQSIYLSGSVSRVEEELKHVAEEDIERQQQRYSFAQILIWAIPMLGFLGTVLGISEALGNISVGEENNFQQMLDGLKGSLYIAFDTTALALMLSMVLMFGQFFVDRFEQQLLQLVGQQAHAEIATHFDLTDEVYENSHSEQLESELLSTMVKAAERQAAIWQESVRATETALTESLKGKQHHVEQNLAVAIDGCVQGLAHTLGESIQRADQSMSHRWEQWQVTLSENARQVAKKQSEFAEQTQVVCKLLEQTATATSEASNRILDQVKEVAEEQQQRNALPEVVFHEPTVSTVLFEPVMSELVMSTPVVLEFVSHEPIVAKPVVQDPVSSEQTMAWRDQPSRTQWVAVSPEFLSEVADHEQVILPFPQAARFCDAGDGGDRGTGFQRSLPPARSQAASDEVVLPFLRKAA